MNKYNCSSKTCDKQMNIMPQQRETCPTCRQTTEQQTPCGSDTDGCQTPGCACYLAIANVPMQKWQETYAVEKGFIKGTIFPELDLPFYGRRVK